ncbi:hypothetical protein ACHQM5_028191 [Ranunculus cassubicifolius]
MKKALDQTLRDLKRGVNKKVLKVPGVEQKVLDATSNEPWGPHGSHLADIAQATRNYHEYQMIMSVLWKRINDTGKNWRHVYKALTVLEYLVANGSERVIDEIKEHAYQISTLSDFQYVDHNGRDQGNNVRKKSQSLVVLVNDKERIMEVRQKASANREKFRTSSTTGGMYRPGSYSSTGSMADRYEDDRYGNRDDDRNGYGRERDWSREEDRNSRGGDSYSRDGDRYGRDSDEYGRDGYRDDESRGRSHSVEGNQYGTRSRSSDAYRDRSYDDDGRYSSRSSGAHADDHPQNERRLERKFSEQNITPPPPYEEAINDTQSPVHDERDAGTAEPPAPKESSPTGSTTQGPVVDAVSTASSPAPPEFGFDEFDPRGSFSASTSPPATQNGEVDFLGSLSDSFSSNALALMPVTSTPEADVPITSSSGPTFVALSSASTVLNQPAQDPFGDSPFKAIPTADNVQTQTSTTTFQPSDIPQTSEPQQTFDFGDTFSGITYTPSDMQLALTEPSVSSQSTDILADILPPSGPQPTYSSGPQPTYSTGPQPTYSTGPQRTYSAPVGQYLQQSPDQLASQGSGQFAQPPPQLASQGSGQFPQQNSAYGNYPPQGGYTAPPSSQGGYMPPSSSQGGFYPQPMPPNNNFMGNAPQQTAYSAPVSSYSAPPPMSTTTQPQPPKKFETKSTVWADTLSKGLVDLNISGPKTNPLADIGVDFDSINRREKRERPAPQTSVTSTITMGKAMGSGTGMGRAGASALAPLPNPGMVPGMGMGGNPGMGMGGNPGMGIGMGGNPSMGIPNMGNYGGYGGLNQPQPMGMGMGMGMNNMGQGGPMRPPQGNYNPMMGPGGYPQQPYGGYR